MHSMAKGIAKNGDLVQADAVVLIRGVIDKRGDEANLICNEIIPLDQIDHRYTRAIRIQLDESKHDGNTLKDIYEIIRGYEGNKTFELVIRTLDNHTVVVESQKQRVNPNDEMRRRLEEILGPGCLHYITEMPKTNGTVQKPKWRKKSGVGV